jgi:DNA-binding YbaB/EbfC family protein
MAEGLEGQEGLGAILRKAQEMQARLKEMQEAAAAERVEGSAGGGLVKVTVTGGQEVVNVEVDPSVIDPQDPEFLGDLIAAASNDALRRSRELLQERLGGLTGGLDIGKLFGG